MIPVHDPSTCLPTCLPAQVRETRAFRAGVASSFQHAAISHLEQRIKYAMKLCAEEAREAGDTSPSTLVVSGGVAANAELRRRLQLLCGRRVIMLWP